MKVICVIPARYSSTRLPGKPLALIGGKPMIEHVYNQARKATRPAKVIVATDHELVAGAVRAFGGEVMLTSPGHPTGTDRLAEVASFYQDADLIINIQGDEPFIAPEVIDALAAAFDIEPGLNMATLMTEMDAAEYQLPSAVKVVTDLNGYALCFSRSLVPYPRVEPVAKKVYKHIGVYAYRREFLRLFASLSPTPWEMTESLEQLRALEHGYKIKVIETSFQSIGVDTPADLAKANEYYQNLQEGGKCK
ncbi:MAG: 3-deoxy-manno-octulosonate cytidylyltransferase [Sporomusaceae bacterium]|jgi:3-deoxy-manno-octulosonate cytidylyltransferase (CMP-KDO synthetase)|nr:3-deoxy-manno-octulosonate cytidylyltransferase [Sporomusaceae bacterium]